MRTYNIHNTSITILFHQEHHFVSWRVDIIFWVVMDCSLLSTCNPSQLVNIWGTVASDRSQLVSIALSQKMDREVTFRTRWCVWKNPPRREFNLTNFANADPGCESCQSSRQFYPILTDPEFTTMNHPESRIKIRLRNQLVSGVFRNWIQSLENPYKQLWWIAEVCREIEDGI